MQIERVLCDDVVVSPRLRAVDSTKIKAMADSMEAIGLQSPITIHRAHIDAEGFDLVAGAHRLAAAKSLGWEYIDAIFTNADEIDRQLWEIDENLIRSELTATQQAEHLAKRKELWSVRDSVASCNTKPGRPKGFDTDTAEKTGVNRSTVNRAVSRAEGVTQEARDAIRGTDLDKGVVLDELRQTEPSDQMDKVKELQSRSQSKEPDIDPDERQFQRLISAWNGASSEARRRFELWVYGD